MDKQALFTVPLYTTDYPRHNVDKELFITYLEKYIENSPASIRNDKISFVTKKSLHTVSIFDNLVKFLGEQCPLLHADFDISLDKSIGVSAMWASKCNTDEQISAQFHTKSFLYGVYMLQTPPLAGKLQAEIDLADRNYFGEINSDTANTVNSGVFQGPLPEGKILLMPAHITTSYSFNLDTSPRYMIHFLLQVLF